MPVAYLLSEIGVYLGFVIYVGGDHAPAHRFLLPLGPSAVLALRLCLAPEALRLKESTRAAVYVGVAALLALQLLRIPNNLTKMDDAAYYGTIVGRHIAQNWPRDVLIALNTAGSTPFVARDHRFLDMLGLNDRHIAHRDDIDYRLPLQRMPGHAKGDGDYVLSREPDFVILGPAFGTTLKHPWFLSDWELAQEPTFRKDYALRKVDLPLPADLSATGFSYARNGVLPFVYFERR